MARRMQRNRPGLPDGSDGPGLPDGSDGPGLPDGSDGAWLRQTDQRGLACRTDQEGPGLPDGSEGLAWREGCRDQAWTDRSDAQDPAWTSVPGPARAWEDREDQAWRGSQ